MLQQVEARILFVTGKLSGKEKETYNIVQWSRLFLAYADLRKYKDVLTGETTIPNQDDPAVKKETDDTIKAEYADILAKSRKAMLELLTAVEKSSVCFLRVSCAGNARKAWLSLKERYEPTTVAEEL